MGKFSKRAVLTAALAAGALAAPTAANAAVSSNVNTDTLTVTSDQAADTITLAAAGGFITVNGQATTLAANNQAKIVVNAGDGADTVDASALAVANYGALTINGGEGADLLTGGAGNDNLRGDGGNDRVIGFKGNDDLEGGAGNDVLVWNNGDGTDVMDGDAGADEVEINGAPTAGDVFTAVPNAGRVLFNRPNLVPFSVDFSAERLTVNGLGGDDTFTGAAGLAPLTLISLNGGTGIDTLTGGDGPDLITGGDDNDVLNGGGGDDRVVGDRGTDTLRGGNDNDVLVWNNGDGSDVSDGDAGFDQVEINGSPTAGDVFTTMPNVANVGRVLFNRTNLVPFTVDFTAEALTVNSGGGDDQLTVSPGLPGLLVTADGGSDNDTLTGAEEADSLVGGDGNDTLTGGRGSDLLDGQAGNDSLFSRDGHGDLVRGGTGNDSARTDVLKIDIVDGVETLDAPHGGRSVNRGHIRVVRSHGRLVARVPRPGSAAETGGGRTTATLIGVARHGRLSTRVQITTRDAAGHASRRSVAVSPRTSR
jgi:Ca2+-binding RTX toxin-like protein